MLAKISYVEIDYGITSKPENINELISFWKTAKQKISKRINHFKNIFKTVSEEAVFAELAFCLFTPQSKAISCWKAVTVLNDRHLLFTSNAKEIAETINNVRFRNNKSEYLVNARDFFTKNNAISIKKELSYFKDSKMSRKWLIDNVKGIGYKEASHFLRNTGIGLDLAILDRHILKNLQFFGVIKEIPKTLNEKKYLEIEKKMDAFCKKIKIPLSHMDLLLWSIQTGGIFK